MMIKRAQANEHGSRSSTTCGRMGLWTILGLILLLSGLVSLKIGASSVSFLQAFRDLFAGETSDHTIVFFEIRLPRLLLGILLGSSLGLAGAAMQGFLRNPLAEPGVLGVNGGAVLGAVLVIYTGAASLSSFALPLGGMAGAFVTVLILYLFSSLTTTVQTLILAGVAINVMAFSATSLVMNLSRDPYGSLEILYWQMGSLADRSFHHIGIALPFIILGFILLFWDSRALNALSLGEETAVSLGIPLRQVRFRLIFGTALAVGAVTSVCGSITFIGLIVPHILRPFVKYEPGRLLGVSAIGGAILVLWADMAIRLLSIGPELKLGVLTSLIGAPFFLTIILKMRRQIS